MNKIIKNPIISEKSFSLAANGKYSFIAPRDLDKNEAKRKVEDIFGVNVTKINSCNIKGKIKKSKGYAGKRNDFKKFLFTLKEKQKIDLFEVEEKKEIKDQKVQDEKKKKFGFIKNDRLKSQINKSRKENDPTALSMQGGGE
jgi:large subunit ribosomal protein L23